MDVDTTSGKWAHAEILDRVASGEVEVLLGTQMIAKGLDFPNVTLVGVINADTALHIPDFRASERTFQLVTQVAGRTGRGDRGGRVLVQTFNPEHAAIQAAVRHDYETFAAGELPPREEHGYPPYASLIRLVVRGPSELQTESFADELADRVREALAGDPADGLVMSPVAANPAADPRVLGPAPAPISKLRGNFRFHIQVHGPDDAQLRRAVRDAADRLKAPEGVLWIADVDPVDML
jgi:primosomal protein N' (replication factor Y)